MSNTKTKQINEPIETKHNDNVGKKFSVEGLGQLDDPQKIINESPKTKTTDKKQAKGKVYKYNNLKTKFNNPNDVQVPKIPPISKKIDKDSEKDISTKTKQSVHERSPTYSKAKTPSAQSIEKKNASPANKFANVKPILKTTSK